MRTIALALFGTMISFSPCLGQNAQVSPERYRKLACLQITREAHALAKRGFALIGLQANSGGREGSRTTSATVIVWPAPSNLAGQKLADLAQADGQMNALEQASIASQCSIQFQRP